MMSEFFINNWEWFLGGWQLFLCGWGVLLFIGLSATAEAEEKIL